jgi:hypothetical protein
LLSTQLIDPILPAFVVCSVIGAAIIVVGLYSLIWGKSKDHHGKPGAAAVAELPTTTPAPAADGKRALAADVETPPVAKCAY